MRIGFARERGKGIGVYLIDSNFPPDDARRKVELARILNHGQGHWVTTWCDDVTESSDTLADAKESVLLEIRRCILQGCRFPDYHLGA